VNSVLTLWVQQKVKSFVTGWASQEGLCSTELVGSAARVYSIKLNRGANMKDENGNIWKEAVMDESM
jgi:hypothetical protein